MTDNNNSAAAATRAELGRLLAAISPEQVIVSAADACSNCGGPGGVNVQSDDESLVYCDDCDVRQNNRRGGFRGLE